jgi:8-oxo-dGTP pyrophosphatase MutT (NUDIX family)
MKPGFTPLHELINQYHPIHKEEIIFKQDFLQLLLHPNAFQRDHLPGHITGSAFVVNPFKSKVILLHHKNLDRWLQPGGHADGDENVLQVALRELEEETGVGQTTLLTQGIFDLDIHPIPERKGFPAHFHYDVRFLFEADDQNEIIVSDESHDVKWVDLSELDTIVDSPSVLRMAKKVMSFK